MISLSERIGDRIIHRVRPDCDVSEGDEGQNRHQHKVIQRNKIAQLWRPAAEQIQNPRKKDRDDHSLLYEVKQAPSKVAYERPFGEQDEGSHRDPFSKASSRLRISASSEDETFCDESAPRTRFFVEPSNARCRRFLVNSFCVCFFERLTSYTCERNRSLRVSRSFSAITCICFNTVVYPVFLPLSPV